MKTAMARLRALFTGAGSQPVARGPGTRRPRKRRRLLLTVAIAMVVFLASVSISIVWVMKSDWFRERVANAIVATVTEATGGRVELGSFSYDWRTLTAEVHGFVLHGTEPADSAPLFRAATVKVRIKILSFLEREVDLASLEVEQPEFHLIVSDDGSTNFPERKDKRRSREPLLEQLIELKVKHFALNRGKVLLNLKELPLDVAGDNLSLAANYDARGPRYLATLATSKLRLAMPGALPLEGGLNLDCALERNRIRFSRIAYQTGRSRLTANGDLRQLANPVVELSAQARIDVGEAGKVMRLPQMRGGVLDFDGTLKYDDHGPVLAGHTRGERLEYRDAAFAIVEARMNGDLLLTPDRITLRRLAVSAAGAALTGEAELRKYSDLRLDGQVSNLDSAQIGPLLGMSPLAWHGIASGPVHVQANVAGRPDATVEAQVEIAPGTSGIPVQGRAGIRYRLRPEQLELHDVSLQFPRSQVTLSGTIGESMTIALDTTAIEDLLPAFTLATAERQPQLPFEMLHGGHIHFAGTLTGPFAQPVLEGQVGAEHVRLEGQVIDRLTSEFQANASHAAVKSLVVEQGPLHLKVHGSMGLTEWTRRKSSALELSGQFEGADLATVGKMFNLPEIQGTASAAFELHGTLSSPQGKVHADLRQLAAYGEKIAHVSVDATASGTRLEVSKLTATEGKSTIALTGHYEHEAANWKSGAVEATVRAIGFRLVDCRACADLAPEWSAAADATASLKADVRDGHLEIRAADGQADLRDVTWGSLKAGSASVKAHTAQGKVITDFDAQLPWSRVAGSFTIGMTADYPVDGSARVAQMTLASVRQISPENNQPLPFDALMKNALVTIHGPLARPREIAAHATVESLEFDPNIPASAKGLMNPETLVLRNAEPIGMDYSNGELRLNQTRFVARDTSLVVGGSVPLTGSHGVRATVEGSLNLQVFQLFDPNVVSSGLSTLRVNVTGALDDPAINGTLELKDAAFHLDKFPNGLERANGLIRFDNHRATIQRLTARSGGGSLSVDGFVTFGQGGPIVYRLDGSATNVRIRYASAVSVTSTASLRFAGTSESSLLSGTITVNKAAFDASADIGALFAATTVPVASPASETDILRGVQMDLQVVSGPNFQLSTSLSQDVEADVDLRLRGSPSMPSVLGRISVRQGQVQVFGNKYSITRGEVSFFNPAKIEPVLDVDLETQVRSITASITITGTPSKLNVNYRSDPPLQPSEIIALLAVGRTPEAVSSLANTQMVNNSSAFTSGANTLLGQALSPVSDRLERLFGVTHIKIDPLVQGLDNSTQTRLTLEQQVSKEVTITYITNLTHTTEQIFRFEWTLSKQYSIVGLRDENGAFGMDLLYHKQFK